MHTCASLYSYAHINIHALTLVSLTSERRYFIRGRVETEKSEISEEGSSIAIKCNCHLISFTFDALIMMAWS